MVEYLKKNFQKIFLEPQTTSANSVRKQIAANLRAGIEVSTSTCEEVVTSVIRYHGRCRDRCHSGHPILQVALKVCFLHGLRDSDIVSDLLTEVYLCENTFEKLFAGAIFGIGAGYLICDWKSDFSTMEENIRAIAYFLEHSNKTRRLFGSQRLAEVTMKNCGLPPLVAALRVRNGEMFKLLARFGAGFVGDGESGRLDSLLQLCKKKILFLLWRNWELPSGVVKLPLPTTVIKYLEKV